jgi:PadR family transcriptional regulator PadR
MDTPVTTKAALLQALIRGPGYGLDLIERVRTLTSGGIELHQGSIYPALREMEREGLLTSYESDPLPERGGRPRRYFKLTAAGARAVMEHRAAVAPLFELPAGAR